MVPGQYAQVHVGRRAQLKVHESKHLLQIRRVNVRVIVELANEFCMRESTLCILQPPSQGQYRSTHTALIVRDRAY